MEYNKDFGRNTHYVFDERKKFYNNLGLTDNQLPICCKRFGYEPYIEHVLVCNTDRELFEKYPDSWKFVRDILKDRNKDGRTCFAFAKDILMDGLITDIIFSCVKKHSKNKNIHIEKSKQDSKLNLLATSSIEPDFTVNGYYLEMKITKDVVDEQGRHTWGTDTLTVRDIYNAVNKQIKRYSEYNKESPLMFLRINAKDKYLIVKSYDKFRNSYSNDGSMFVYYKGKKNNNIDDRKFFNNCDELGISIIESIKKEIEYIEKIKIWKR